jgi:hypothetical protein
VVGRFINVKSNYSWCYGVCFEKSLEETPINNVTLNNGISNVPGPFSELKDGLIKKWPILIGIILLIGIISWIGSLRSRKSNFVVYKKI